jgi:hypothetical protein
MLDQTHFLGNSQKVALLSLHTTQTIYFFIKYPNIKLLWNILVLPPFQISRLGFFNA